MKRTNVADQREPITYRAAVRNFRSLLSEIDEDARLASQNWYLRQHNEIARLANLHGATIPLEANYHMVAALSPGCPWDRNLTDYCDLLDALASNEIETFRPQTYPNQKRKAILIYSLAECHDIAWRGILRGPKERAFAENLTYPEAEHMVTIDFHVWSIAANTRWTHNTLPKNFTVLERREVDRAIRTVAQENKLKACELQAILWEHWRETRKAPRFLKQQVGKDKSS